LNYVDPIFLTSKFDREFTTSEEGKHTQLGYSAVNMSQSPYVYDNKSNRPTSQGYNLTDPNVGTPTGLNGYGQIAGYNQYPVPQQAQRQQQTGQTQPQAQGQQAQQQAQPTHQATQQQQAGSQGQINRGGYPYNTAYSQFDQNQSHTYNNQLQQIQPQYPQNLYQQQQFSGMQTGAGNLPYNQGNYLNNNAYQSMPNTTYGAVPSSGTYAYPYQAGAVQTTPGDNSPYKHQPQVSSASNVGLASTNPRAAIPVQQPGLLDPNQLPQRPKLTTTFWEDEGTVCYQVESRGISVSRREDTNFINGTKLLNVAGMTRGRRDGILKSEKVRYVVKIGAMNLKGVWIPFERALELARNEGIVDVLYPLFVKDIKELYQGPQFSGGLTAAANSNPKNIIPVTVTNSTYTPGTFDAKDKKKSQQSQQQPQQNPVDSTHQPQQQNELHPQNQQFSYGYSYQYQPTAQDPQYAIPQQGNNSSGSLQQYKQTGYHGYQQAPIPGVSDPTKEDGTIKSDAENEKAA
jgi:protein SOK2